MKPMLACDWDPKRVRFPVWVQPKIDGVRALNLHGAVTGRSMDQFGNRYINEMFTAEQYIGFDGEMAAESETNPALCRLTTSALNRHEGHPFVLWWVFDWVTTSSSKMPYIERYFALKAKLAYYNDHMSYVQGHMNHPCQVGLTRLRLMPYRVARDIVELAALDEQNIALGYEGTILRDPQGLYKSGRCTAREANLTRIKAFVEEDAVVTGVSEGQTNLNEAIINALGNTERSTHQENMVGNSMVGTLHCTDVKTGQQIDVAPGCMTHAERRAYFDSPATLIGQTIKYKTFKHGVKDKPRFPTFQSIRMKADKV